VSPQNVLVGVDGVARVFDFGVAKAHGRMQTTQDGSLKGKMAYMAPEQLTNDTVDRRTDIWAASVVLWEMLAGQRLFYADSSAALVNTIMTTVVPPPSKVSACPKELDDVVLMGLAKDKAARFQTAREMAIALEKAMRPASSRAIGEWLEHIAHDALTSRAKRVEEMESAAGIPRPSRGTLSARLAAIGLESNRALAEEPTAAPRGRVGRTSAPPPPADAQVAPSAQFNAMSVAGLGSTTNPPPARSTSPWILGAFALGLFTALAGGVVWVRAQTTAPRQPAARESAAGLPASNPTHDTAPTTPATQTPQPIVGATATATGAATATSTLTGAAPSTATVALRGAQKIAPKPPAKAAADKAGPKATSTKNDCDPPYTIGPAPDFIKKPKLECLPQ
jgi:serine/threonine-protein kinase